MMCGSIFAIYFVIHGQQLWYPQILSYYSQNNDVPITICEAITLGRTAQLSIINITNALNRWELKYIYVDKIRNNSKPNAVPLYQTIW